ncbi:transglutaminase [Verrucomicrobia bacterium LW23]|nr:transglutaminase [Verrucomicrobia bacterium LW23]
MKYSISHSTEYKYGDAVSVSHHSAHLTPREVPERQRTLSASLKISPEPAVRLQRVDYYGNAFTVFIVQEPHDSLVVESRSTVEVLSKPVPDPAKTPAWEEVRDLCAVEVSEEMLAVSEFVYDSTFIKTSPELLEFATPSFPPGRTILAGAIDLTRRINKGFIFDPAATTVSTPLRTVLMSRRGVCQDFAHLQIGCLRALGLPARYVSGYIETMPPAGTTRLRGADASHAWVAVWCPGLGWVDLDPTNNQLCGTQHVTVAWGRDFGDVSPLRGVTYGGGNSFLYVSVDVEAETSDRERSGAGTRLEGAIAGLPAEPARPAAAAPAPPPASAAKADASPGAPSPEPPPAAERTDVDAPAPRLEA